MSDHDDFAQEPIPGLPALLPPGEALLWQGAPRWQSLAVHAYHARKVALYFVALAAWRLAAGSSAGHSLAADAVGCAWLIGLGCIAVGVLSLLAYCSARMTVYSITSERVVLRHGVAVPLTMNVPYALIEAAAVKGFRDGTGDIALTVAATQRVGYLISWPHVRPARITRPQPSFRNLPDVERAAQILRQALALHVAARPPVLGVVQATPGAAPLIERPASIAGRRTVAAA